MNENEAITFENMPEAMMQLMHKVEVIKNNLLNQATSTKEAVIITPEDEFITIKEVSQMIKISEGSIYNMTYTRQIPCIKKGSRVLFERQAIRDWMREDRQKTVKQLEEETEKEFQNK